ncbi:MAG: sensor domain-containing diguanylate cyclase [bacterium]
MNKLDLWDINVRKITRALGTGLGGCGYAVVTKANGRSDIKYIEGMDKKNFSKQLKKPKRYLNFTIDIGNHNYQLYILQKKITALTEKQSSDINILLSLISMALTMRQVSRDRITETQIINQLNLNITTSLDANKITNNLESAARRMIKNNDILIYYRRDDNFVGSNNTFRISRLPKSTYTKLFKIQHLFTVPRRNIATIGKIIPLKAARDITFVPFTIKNELRGFFVLSGTATELSENFILTRIKFLANQAGLALERIDLFRKMNSALRESHGLQNLIKIMISSLDLESLSNEILQRAQEFLGFKRILFSVYDPKTHCFRRITGVGVSKRKLEEAKGINPPLEAISELLHNRFRISNSYYIPARDAMTIGKQVRRYELYKSAPIKNRIPELWDPGDIFLSPIYSKDREIVALLSLDMPMSNLVPILSNVRLLETFGDFLGMAIENAQMFKKIERLSNTDEMTGVRNYRFLREKFEFLIKNKVSPISLIMIDLDNFKECNDSYGHLYGDEILRIFSECLVDMIGKRGYVVRYGGDEFIILLPKTSKKICKTLINKVVNHQHKPYIYRRYKSCGFSYGFAEYPKNGLNLGALIDYADKLLYQQKSEKHNEH